MIRKNWFSNRAKICYLELAILIVSSFAVAYLIANTNSAADELQVGKEIGGVSLFSMLGNFFRAWWQRSSISLVSAATTTTTTNNPLVNTYQTFDEFGKVNVNSLALNCCTKLKNNAICQDITNAQCADSCAVACLPTKCNQVNSCKIGCCYDSKEGLCQNNMPKQSCQDSGGSWSDDANCNVEECNNGCCILGNNAEFVTEKRCEKLAGFDGLPVDFRANMNSEVDCLALANSQAEGACILVGDDSRGCKFTTKAECIKISGDVTNFYENYLCSNPELNTTCVRQASKSCLEGKDEVYWHDSCGNRENIYSSDKTASWNSGKVLTKDKSCNPLDSNINSDSCGNCNRFGGSICSNGKCQDLNCNQAPNTVDAFGKIISKKDRKNGEAWCVYDGVIGNGRDVVGSRHYKYYCEDGVVKSEPCGDYRTGICVAQETNDNGKTFSQAACRPNTANECIAYNTADENKNTDGKMDPTKVAKQCLDNVDCQVRTLSFGKGYSFSVCTPKYPLGFDLTNEVSAKVGKAMCDQADFTCTKYMVKDWKGSWKCEAGCNCDSASFTQQMNDWCVSMGDCGGYVNIAGKVASDGYTISGAPAIDLNQYKKNAVPVIGQKAIPGNVTNILMNYYGWGAANPDLEDQPDYSGNNNVVSGIVGALGVGMVYSAVLTGSAAGTAAVSGGLAANLFGTGAAGASVFASIGWAAIGAAIGFFAGTMIAKWLGLTGYGALAMAIGGAALGLGIALLIMGISNGWNIVGWILLVVGALLMIYTWLIGWGTVKKKVSTFNCEPWQAPRGGDDCSKCGTDLKPCTKYECQSLGQLCELINEGTGKEICLANNVNDVNAPVISPWKEIITPGFKYADMTESGFKLLTTGGGCLQEFQPVLFGISTDEPAHCKLSLTHTGNYDIMGETYFDDSTLYLYNHTMVFNMPSVDSLFANLSDELNASQIASLKAIALQKYGNLTFYVRCQDKTGNSNINEYFIKTCVDRGRDITKPYITKTSPEENSWLAYGQNSSPLKIWVSEPADCKYDTNDRSYSNMSKTLDCIKDYDSGELMGWPCTTQLNGLGTGDNNFYIRCKDLPELPDTNTSRNIMDPAFMLTLKETENPLTIDSMEPNGTMIVGVEPATATLRVRTSGGAEDGKSICQFSFTGYESMADSFASDEEYVFNQLIRGSYTIYVICKDAAGNEARATTSFTIDTDIIAPLVIRAYNSGEMKIITNEDSSCVYGDRSCSFAWANGTTMSGILSREHTASWESGKTYYIKCEDIWNNKPDSCSIILRAIDSAVQENSAVQ